MFVGDLTPWLSEAPGGEAGGGPCTLLAEWSCALLLLPPLVALLVLVASTATDRVPGRLTWLLSCRPSKNAGEILDGAVCLTAGLQDSSWACKTAAVLSVIQTGTRAMAYKDVWTHPYTPSQTVSIMSTLHQ